MSETVVIVRERAYELYVVDVPVYRGMESWSGIREEAYHFESEAEATELLKEMRERNPDLIFIHIKVKNGKEIMENKSDFQLSVEYAPYNSRLWFVKDITEAEALTIAFQDVKTRKEAGIKSIKIINKD